MKERIASASVKDFRRAAKGRLLVPVSLAATLKGVSRQRIYAMMDNGRLASVVVCQGWLMVDLNQL